MSGRGGFGRGGGRGGSRGSRGGRGGRDFGGRGFGRGRGADFGPPASVVEVGVFKHPCEGELVCKLTNEGVRARGCLCVQSAARPGGSSARALPAAQVPQFNAFMFLENKTQIGKVDEIFGSIKDVVSHGRLASELLQAEPGSRCLAAVLHDQAPGRHRGHLLQPG